jgi:hypothetical protein
VQLFDPIMPSGTLALRATIAAAVLDDGAVLLDLTSKYFYSLNGSAWAIVQLFETGASPRDVEGQCLAWGADSHVGAFIKQLYAYDLLETSEPATGILECGAWQGRWVQPTIDRQAEPLERVIVSAFDPSIPLAE